MEEFKTVSYPKVPSAASMRIRIVVSVFLFLSILGLLSTPSCLEPSQEITLFIEALSACDSVNEVHFFVDGDPIYQEAFPDLLFSGPWKQVSTYLRPGETTISVSVPGTDFTADTTVVIGDSVDKLFISYGCHTMAHNAHEIRILNSFLLSGKKADLQRFVDSMEENQTNPSLKPPLIRQEFKVSQEDRKVSWNTYTLPREWIQSVDEADVHIELTELGQRKLKEIDFFQYNYLLVEGTGVNIRILDHFVAMKSPDIFLYRREDGHISSLDGSRIYFSINHMDKDDIRIDHYAQKLTSSIPSP